MPKQVRKKQRVKITPERTTMLRAGLTGGLGSGKSTVAQYFRSLGAYVIEADAVARGLMSPGQPVFNAIVKLFGRTVVRADGTLDRRLLAELAFRQNRLAELNRIVHPPVIAAQQQWADSIFAKDPDAVAIVESALIFEADQQGSAPGWRQRFQKIILVTAPAELRIARYVDRLARCPGAPPRSVLEADARSRIAAQLSDDQKIPLAHFVIRNDGSLDGLRAHTERVYAELAQTSRVPAQSR
jgi:dephospho-CoA kinase